MRKSLKTPSSASAAFSRLRLSCLALLAASSLGLMACGSSGSRSHPDLPIGNLDTPTTGTAVSGPVQVAGWAYAKDSISEVAIYVDGHYVQAASTDLPRPDVTKAYPDITNPSGWSVMLDTSNLSAGNHVLVAQAHSSAGAARDLGGITITKN